MGNKKVTCIRQVGELEVGKEYEVIEEDENLYFLRLPPLKPNEMHKMGGRGIYVKRDFTEVLTCDQILERIDLKIKKINDLKIEIECLKQEYSNKLCPHVKSRDDDE